MRRLWIATFALALMLVMTLPVGASETNVYGDPGSGSFSVAMAVVSDDASGKVFTVGVFFGDFQGVQSNQWDVWMGEIGPNGQLIWVTTWDAPEIDTIDFSQNLLDPAWAGAPADITVASDGTVIGVVRAGGSSTVVQSSTSGADRGHTVLPFDGRLVGGDNPALIGWTNESNPRIQRLALDGSVDWLVSSWASGRTGPLLVNEDGSVVAGIQLDRLSFQSAAVSIKGLDAGGSAIWETELNEACFMNGQSLTNLGGEIGVLLEPPRAATPSTCDVDQKMVASLNAENGQLVAMRTLKDTLNILWCTDPRQGPISGPPLETGFTDGDECGGNPVYWTDTNYPLIAVGSEIEAFAIVGMEIVNQGYLGYGILRTVVNNDRWTANEYEFFAPATGMMPYDMQLTPSGPIIVGRAFNTAWISSISNSPAKLSQRSVNLAASTTGAAVLVTSGMQPSGRFLDDNGSVFEADIEWLAAKGITKGCNPPSNTGFCPSDLVTRGQMAAFLVRGLGYADNGGGNLFTDDDGTTFENDIDKLGTAGVTKGCNPPANDHYCPDGYVTRGQMAAFLVRAFGYMDNGGGNLFLDDDTSIFESDIDKLGTAGVTKGCNPPANDMFCPSDYVTRAQMAAFLHRAIGG